MTVSDTAHGRYLFFTDFFKYFTLTKTFYFHLMYNKEEEKAYDNR